MMAKLILITNIFIQTMNIPILLTCYANAGANPLFRSENTWIGAGSRYQSAIGAGLRHESALGAGLRYESGDNLVEFQQLVFPFRLHLKLASKRGLKVAHLALF